MYRVSRNRCPLVTVHVSPSQRTLARTLNFTGTWPLGTSSTYWPVTEIDEASLVAPRLALLYESGEVTGRLVQLQLVVRLLHVQLGEDPSAPETVQHLLHAWTPSPGGGGGDVSLFNDFNF